MNYLKRTLAVLLLVLLLPAAGCKETTMTTETQTRTTIPPEVQGDAASSKPSISADGHLVAFESDATNLVVGSTNGARSIYLKDTRTGATTRISSTSAGVNGNNDSANPAISAGGRFVTFDFTATNLVPGDTGSQCVTASGYNSLALSDDGRFVAFESAATNLVPGDANGKRDVFVKDTQTGAIALASADAAGTQATRTATRPSASQATAASSPLIPRPPTWLPAIRTGRPKSSSRTPNRGRQSGSRPARRILKTPPATIRVQPVTRWETPALPISIADRKAAGRAVCRVILC
ncbi:MAG: TolB family protein [Thermoleophilia bacterium]